MPPGRFLSDAEIERLGAFPETIDRRDVVRFFSLAGEDLGFVRGQRGAGNQLGIALQLGALRWLGFVAVPCWSSWKTGMSSFERRRRSISKQRGAEISSRLMPPKVGAAALTNATICSTLLVSM